MLQLHRIAPELFWAKDPIASFAVGEKDSTKSFPLMGNSSEIVFPWSDTFFKTSPCWKIMFTEAVSHPVLSHPVRNNGQVFGRKKGRGKKGVAGVVAVS